ncbi:MAG: YraN family protein [Pseudomonadota bacterium]
MSRRSAASRRRAERAGRVAEWIAAFVFIVQGFSILARRYKTPLGEIDLIAKRGRLLVFAEVKARKRLETALEAVGDADARRISDAASLFLAKRPDLAHSDMRYDILAVARFRLAHVKDAWREFE